MIEPSADDVLADNTDRRINPSERKILAAGEYGTDERQEPHIGREINAETCCDVDPCFRDC